MLVLTVSTHQCDSKEHALLLSMYVSSDVSVDEM